MDCPFVHVAQAPRRAQSLSHLLLNSGRDHSIFFADKEHIVPSLVVNRTSPGAHVPGSCVDVGVNDV